MESWKDVQLNIKLGKVTPFFIKDLPLTRRVGKNIQPKNHKYYKEFKNTFLKTLQRSKLNLNYIQYCFLQVAWDPCFVLFFSNVQHVRLLLLTSARDEKIYTFVHEKRKGIPALQGYQFFLIYLVHLWSPVKASTSEWKNRTKLTVFQFCDYFIQSMNYLRYFFHSG